MRHAALLSFMLVSQVACSHAQIAAAGRPVHADLRAKLPPGATTGSSQTYVATAKVCGVFDSPNAAIVSVRLEAITSESKSYVAGYVVELAKPRDGGIVLEETEFFENAHVAAAAPAIGSAIIPIRCAKASARPEWSVILRADGTLESSLNTEIYAHHS